jgi:hypothetical protein
LRGHGSDIDARVAEFARADSAVPAWYRNVDRSWQLWLPPWAAVTIPRSWPAIMLAGCGHWTEQERAPEVSAAMIDFLRSL